MRRLGTTATALAIAAAGLAMGTTGAAHAADRAVVLDKGHIDLFEVAYDAASSGLRLQVKDDTELHADGPVLRDPADVTIAVDEERAATAVPDFAPWSFLGSPGDTVYLLPMTQDAELPWPGWSTERLVSTLPAGTALPDTADAVRLEVEVEGPGEVHSFMDDMFGNPINHYVDSSDGGPDIIPVARHAHVHTNWSFSEPGEYTFEVTPTATTTTGGTLTGPTANYHIRVGDPAPSELGLDVTANQPDATYLYGQGITLTAAPTAATDLDHYHWFVKGQGGSDFVVSDRSLTNELKLPTSLVWDGAQVIARLYDAGHHVVAESAPITLRVSQLPRVTTLTAQADKASYAVGETAHFTSTQSPETGEDHFHWYARQPVEEFFTYIPDSNQATADLPITADLDGAEVIARLFDHDHAVIAESAPVLVKVAAPVVQPPAVQPPATGKLATQVSAKLKKRIAAHQRAKLKVTVALPALPGTPAAGKVVIRDGGRKIATGVMTKGTIAVRLPRLKPGKHRIKVVYKGDTATERSVTTQVVRVRR